MGNTGLPTLEEQRKFWDTKWRREQLVYPNPWAIRRGDSVLEILKSTGLKSGSFLDLGCGAGWFAARLAELGPTTGIDLSPEGIEQARKQYPAVMFLAGNAMDLDLEGQQFDAVVSQEVIAHVEDQPAFLDRIHYLLKPNGYLVLTTPNRWVVQRAGAFDFNIPGHIEKYMNMGQFKRLVATRFKVLHARTLIPLGDRGILRVVNSSKLNRLLSLVIPAEKLERMKEGAGLGYMLVVLAQKMSNSPTRWKAGHE